MVDDNPYVAVLDDGRKVITDEGHRRLDGLVTTTTGSVYVITGKVPQATTAAAMARLSRRPGDLRITLLEEFLDQDLRDGELLERVITQFGDDSVQQLVSVDFAVEGCSNLLTKLLEWPRFGAYLEQSTRYIPFDQLGADGHFNFFVPEELVGELREHYITEMDGIFAAYSLMIDPMIEHVRSTTGPSSNSASDVSAWRNASRATALDAVRALLPVATRSTVGVHMSAQTLENLIIIMRASDLLEARTTADALLIEARRVIPDFLKRADRPTQGNMRSMYRTSLQHDLGEQAARLTGGPVDDGDPVRLIDYWPLNENDLLAGMLFPYTALSIEEIARQIAEWPIYDQENIWRAAIGAREDRRDRPGRAFEKAHYEFTVVGDYGTFRDLQRHRVVDAMEWQMLTPAHAYAIPDLVTNAGLEKAFIEVFARSERLYDHLREQVSPAVAQYATLLGHRMRYRLIVNGRALYHLLELRTGKAGHPGYRRICQQMFALIEQVHPQLAGGMKYVDLKPPTGLGRLAAEERTARKLAAIEARDQA